MVNERDGLGDETPPDYLTSVRDGGFYGWPYCYWGQTVDDRVPQDPAAVAKAITPDYALGGHTASLGLCWLPAGTLPGFPDGMVIGQHGSWNRSTLSGYKVVFVPFENGRPAGPARDILSGLPRTGRAGVLWPTGRGHARSRRLGPGGGRCRRCDLARHRRAAGLRGCAAVLVGMTEVFQGRFLHDLRQPLADHHQQRTVRRIGVEPLRDVGDRARDNPSRRRGSRARPQSPVSWDRGLPSTAKAENARSVLTGM